MKKNIAIGLFVSIIVVLNLWCSYLMFHTPYHGIYLKVDERQQWVIKELDPGGAGVELGLRVGDVVRAVDGKQPDESPYVYRWRTVEQAHTLTIARDGRELAFAIRNNHTLTEYFVPLTEALVCFAMAIAIMAYMRRFPSARMLAAVFLTIALIYMSRGASVRGDVIGKLLITNLMTFLPIVFYHFLVVFFREKGNMKLPTRILPYMYAVFGISFAIRSFMLYPPYAYPIFQYNEAVTLSLFIVGFLYNLGVLAMLYVRIRKQQSYVATIVRSVILSWAISFLPVICLSFLPQILTGHRVLNAVYTSWIILLFPISFAYLIAVDRLYNVGLVLRRLLFAGLLAVIPVSLFTGLYVFLFRHSIDEKQIMFVFIGSLLLLTSVLYAAEYLITRLEPVLFPRKFVLQSALKKIAKNLGTISSFRDLKAIILADIVETLQVMGAAIVLRYKNEIEVIPEGDIDVAEIEHLAGAMPAAEHPQYTFIEMNSHELYTSYLVITRKKSNLRLGKEELQWLRLITSYLEVSLENVHLIRKLTARLQQLAAQLPDEETAQDIQWFRKVMFELQEEERIRIATDLHDTTMQDLFFLKRRLAKLGERAALPKEDPELGSMIHFVEMINAGLRESCFELNPHLLKEVGLIQTLETYVEKEAFTAPFLLEFVAEEVEVADSRDLQTNRHVFRIVQELLANAKKHSRASKVTFRITETPGMFQLYYEDNGVGFDYSNEPNFRIGSSGTGIKQIKSRILQIGGQLEFITQAGRGTRVIVSIPAKEAASA